MIEIGISDHSLVYSCLKISVPREKPKDYRRMNTRDYLKKKAVRNKSKSLY